MIFYQNDLLRLSGGLDCYLSHGSQNAENDLLHLCRARRGC